MLLFMSIIKYISQLIGAFVYANIFSLILYVVTVLPLAFVLSLQAWQIIILIILFGGFLEFLQHTIIALSTVPFHWIVKGSLTALICAIGLIVYNVARNIYNVWIMSIGNGNMAVFVAIIITLFLLKFIIFSSLYFIKIYSSSD